MPPKYYKPHGGSPSQFEALVGSNGLPKEEQRQRWDVMLASWVRALDVRAQDLLPRDAMRIAMLVAVDFGDLEVMRGFVGQLDVVDLVARTGGAMPPLVRVDEQEAWEWCFILKRLADRDGGAELEAVYRLGGLDAAVAIIEPIDAEAMAVWDKARAAHKRAVEVKKRR